MKSKLYLSLVAFNIALVMSTKSVAQNNQNCDACDELENGSECCTTGEIIDGRCCDGKCLKSMVEILSNIGKVQTDLSIKIKPDSYGIEPIPENKNTFYEDVTLRYATKKRYRYYEVSNSIKYDIQYALDYSTINFAETVTCGSRNLQPVYRQISLTDSQLEIDIGKAIKGFSVSINSKNALKFLENFLEHENSKLKAKLNTNEGFSYEIRLDECGLNTINVSDCSQLAGFSALVQRKYDVESIMIVKIFEDRYVRRGAPLYKYELEKKLHIRTITKPDGIIKNNATWHYFGVVCQVYGPYHCCRN